MHEAMISAQALDAMWCWKALSTERNISPVVLETQNSAALSTVHLGLNMFGLRMRRMSHMLFGWSAGPVLFTEAAKAPAEVRRMRTNL